MLYEKDYAGEFPTPKELLELWARTGKGVRWQAEEFKRLDQKSSE